MGCYPPLPGDGEGLPQGATWRKLGNMDGLPGRDPRAVQLRTRLRHTQRSTLTSIPSSDAPNSHQCFSLTETPSFFLPFLRLPFSPYIFFKFFLEQGNIFSGAY